MNAWQGAMAALVMGTVAGEALAREPDVDGMKTWSMPSYTLYARETWQAREVAERLPLIEQALLQFLGDREGPSPLPTYIYMSPPGAWHDYLQPSGTITAEFVPARFGYYLLLDGAYDTAGMRVALAHEYAHYFLRSRVNGAYPLWFDEGFAQIVETAEFGRQRGKIGLPQGDYGPQWIPLARLMRVDKQSPEYLERSTHSFHHQSWAFVHKAMLDDREFGAKMFQFLNRYSWGESIEVAVPASFGLSMKELDLELQKYARRGKFKAGVIESRRDKSGELGPERRLSDFESLELLARIMLDTGLNTSRVGEVIAAARALQPDATSVRVMDFQLAAWYGSDSDVDAKWQALSSPAAADPAVARVAGVALYARLHYEIVGTAQSSAWLPARAQRAFELLSQAEHSLPVDVESAWAFGHLSAWLNRETDFALQRLQLASGLVPRNADLAMVMALLHERLSQTDLMRQQLEMVGRYTRTVSQRLWAWNRIKALQGGAGGSR